MAKSKNDVFLVCEEVGHHSDGTLTLKGLFPGRVIPLDKPSAQPTKLARLSFYAEVWVAQTIEKAQALVVDPKGAKVRELEEIFFLEGATQTALAISFLDFKFETFGEHRLVLRDQDTKADINEWIFSVQAWKE